ncbi:tetratricopeptide repeat protein [Lutimaribacter saemankumensis]|uniref:Flp pilus assembly protein TadD, contains TPR repeats n=1 Tax=Lutimaribacter saemankumensis TaxID=490829 RepID=A0A1G8MGF1_9RHOB|nr:tetratricopeptide repeat protein [Lutimaribacter saemankumensis]SDI66996.1 Flp pilus assembly protein TadD, contains TPR repeats [Lutimaribacter saemankumensis]
MRHPILISLCIAGSFSLSACEQRIDKDKVDRAFQEVDVIDESNLSDIMLTVADPNEAVSYFARATKEKPERIDLQRGLASSLVRAKRNTEAVSAWQKVVKHADSTNDDQVDLADAYIRAGQWKEAEETLDKVPPTYETFKRYRLEAMIADSNKEWKKADSFYDIAVGLTTRPAGVLNNWGYSKLTRGEYAEAERLFGEALDQDGTLFTAKNNLVLARGAQRKYTLPVIPMDQVERAQLLHTLGLSAVKQGDVATGKTLLREAVETHPQHFEAAVRSLRALEDG